MKTKTIILAFTLGAATQALAADPSAATSSTIKSASASANAVTVNVPKKTWHVANPFAPVKAGGKKYIDRIGNLSSRPWTQIVGWHSGEPSSFMDAKNNVGEGWPLFWFGSEPER